MALEQNCDKKIKKRLKCALSSLQILSHSVNDLLDYSQISIGTIKLNKCWIKLQDLLEEVIKSIKIQSKIKNLAFTVICDIDFSKKI